MLEAVDLFCHLRCDKPAYVLGPLRKTVDSPLHCY